MSGQIVGPVETPGVTRLTDAQREGLMAKLDADGYCVLPEKLPEGLIEECLAAIGRIAGEVRGSSPGVTLAIPVKMSNCVDLDPAFGKLLLYEPALQLSYDAFGPMFHLNQSNFISRPRDVRSIADFLSASPWHADGPRPALFPRVGGKDGAMGLHYLKFGYFFTDLTHKTGGSLQVVKGSHKRPELDNRGKAFNIGDYSADLVTFDCPRGAVVAFHQAQWHAAPPNQSEIERKNAYISYCPTWIKPLDRELPRAGELAPGLTAEEAWLRGEYRAPLHYWLPRGEDSMRMARFKRDADESVRKVANYDQQLRHDLSRDLPELIRFASSEVIRALRIMRGITSGFGEFCGMRVMKY